MKCEEAERGEREIGERKTSKKPELKPSTTNPELQTTNPEPLPVFHGIANFSSGFVYTRQGRLA